ncbi:MAG: hypothetical protein ACR2PS_12245, partial [Pseudomonadales bacterium]
MRCNNGKSRVMYGVSRIDDDVHHTHAWRVSLCRHGKRHVKNFPDKKCGAKRKALEIAKCYRDELLIKLPPISRKEFCLIRRSNNNSGITGVCKYAKPYRLSDGTVRKTWYWEANWPNDQGEGVSECFSVKEYGEVVARQMAIRAREKGLQGVVGHFWASERGAVEANDQTRTLI